MTSDRIIRLVCKLDHEKWVALNEWSVDTMSALAWVYHPSAAGVLTPQGYARQAQRATSGT